MPTIHAVKAFNDNYIWLICQDQQAIIIDAGDNKPVLDYLAIHQLIPIAMLITHHHNDHTGGVAGIKSVYPDMQVIAHQHHGVQADAYVDEGGEFNLMGLDFKVWRTAGHTDTHLSFLCQIDECVRVFCGDTLFSGGCGRVFTGTIEELFASMMRFNRLSDETLFYPAHEYTLNNLKFGLSICADEVKNDIQNAITEVQTKLSSGQASLPTTLAHERKINVFLQDHQQMIEHIKQQYPLTNTSGIAIFTALRILKDNF
ncbi:hydroxyacylglutathione hydrolase [Moraxella oculi]|uniref:Hydroxyacylglutathione hydrolase n=1 Tax=Moraxella oculi TaxID=2940516 RepID=A0ABW8U3D4_9GAMM